MTIDRIFTHAEVSSHCTKDDLYMIVNDNVYNLTPYLSTHPGGENVLIDLAGQDATQAFEDIGHSIEARKELKGFEIGRLVTSMRHDQRLEKSIAKNLDYSVLSLVETPFISDRRSTLASLTTAVFD
ncbi:cytochrome b5-like heme/steroid binding domain-containing protein [Xylogone sp. PMI_703]|nr:cytochrome b5-like heme/steroid binding domain-containing protein [Xylogone sp. PMI_703]